jgi:hypothetical protein
MLAYWHSVIPLASTRCQQGGLLVPLDRRERWMTTPLPREPCMKHILMVSLAIVAIGSLPESTPSVPSSVPPWGARATQTVAPETRSFALESPPGGVGGETVTRNGDLISGDMFIGERHSHYEGRIAANGTIPRLDIRTWRSGTEAKRRRVLTAIVGRDTAMLIEHIGSHVDTLRFAAQPGLLPVINPSMGLLELVVARARLQKSRSAKIPILGIDALDLDSPGKEKVEAGTMPVDVTFLAADTVRLGNPKSADQVRMIIGTDGRIRSARSGSTAKSRFSMRPTLTRAPSK